MFFFIYHFSWTFQGVLIFPIKTNDKNNIFTFVVLFFSPCVYLPIPGCILAALGHSWAAFVLLLGALGRSWDALGRSGALLGRSWAALECSWGAQGRSWDALAAFLYYDRIKYYVISYHLISYSYSYHTPTSSDGPLSERTFPAGGCWWGSPRVTQL